MRQAGKGRAFFVKIQCSLTEYNLVLIFQILYHSMTEKVILAKSFVTASLP